MANPPTFVDTQYVIALVNERDRHHEAARAAAERYDGEPLLTTDAVLLEIGNALSRGYKAEAVAIIEGFLTFAEAEVVPLTPELFAAALALYRSYTDKEWGLVDCVSFVVMRGRGLTDALTFDAHFTQAGFRALLRES